MNKWYQDQHMITVEYPPYWLKFSIGSLTITYIYNEGDVTLLIAKVKQTASTYIQDRDILDNLRCEFLTESNGAIYGVTLV